MNEPIPVPKVALVTGAARRVGAAIVERLHGAGYQILLNYRHSAEEAQALAARLNALRAGSVELLPADLCQMEAVQQLAELASQRGVGLLVNNASSFDPTPLGAVSEAQWQALFDSNLKAPFFLLQALLPTLRARRGAVVNLIDIYAERPLQGYSVYSISKAGLAMLTRSMARELAPDVRVNGVAPGAILWPEQPSAEQAAAQQRILAQTPLGRTGRLEEIAEAVHFLAEATYVTGQIIAVDGGRSLYL
ncbi:MAG TPA: pteridine reductase [Pseudomonadales bacterium]|nr:pteridine reductase [Pseudomonadales bacterium]HNL32074.1 pteridine reductase [Pseudomonadales bacterium]HNN35518.1 pteridine reductase [Pseudomonadales bacterium]